MQNTNSDKQENLSTYDVWKDAQSYVTNFNVVHCNT